MQRLIRRRRIDEPAALGTLHPVLRRVYAARRVDSLSDLETAIGGLVHPDRLDGMAEAVGLLVDALDHQQRILVIGDFDADGATSTALVVWSLTRMGAQHVDYLVPNRFEYGYGLTPEIVAVAGARGADLIVTVDNGVSSVEGVAAAKARGMRVLVTDHHLPGPVLPDADAILNPNGPGNEFPSKHLAGVGVAFYLMLGLRGRLRETGWFAEQGIAETNLAEALDLVALGTVADVVALDRNNRILVQQGLARIRAGRGRPGIQALIEVSRRDAGRLVAQDLGFCLGPRLNAAGRLEDMSIGIECLLATDSDRARRLAGELDALNRERREIEADMQLEAMALLDALQCDEERLPAGICLYQPHWHQGVIGILASRVKERFHRPAIVFAEAGDGSLKGSARSIPGLHIRDALDAIATAHPGLLAKFGGHAMAAGLSLAAGDFERFGTAFDDLVRARLHGDAFVNVIETDGGLEGGELTLDVAQLLRAAGPWGQAFPEPMFDDLFEVADVRVLGGRHLKLAVTRPGDARVLDVIAFNQAQDHALAAGDRIRLAYHLDVNVFRGNQALQLIAEHIESAAEAGRARRSSA